MVVLLLAETTHVPVSPETVRRWLRRENLVWRRPRPVLRPSDPQRRAKLRKLRKLLRNLPADEIAVFQDEVDVNLNPKIGSMWMLCGVQAEVPGYADFEASLTMLDQCIVFGSAQIGASGTVDLNELNGRNGFRFKQLFLGFSAARRFATGSVGSRSGAVQVSIAGAAAASYTVPGLAPSPSAGKRASFHKRLLQADLPCLRLPL